MLYLGTLATALSGSLNGTVFSHNRGGPYARARAIPVDPDTTEQQALRETMGLLADRWSTTLSVTQRDAWSRFAQGNKHHNRIGQLHPISGRAEFFRANIIRGQASVWLGSGLAFADDPSQVGPTCDPPTGFSLSNTDPVVGTFEALWNSANEWANEAGSGLLVYISDPQPQVINWFRAPYTLVQFITEVPSGHAAFDVPAIAPIASGIRLFWRVRVTRTDGRISQPLSGKIDT